MIFNSIPENGRGRSARLGAQSSAVHPHRRGEHPQVWQWSGDVVGSSPQARGTPYDHPYDHGVLRFIPTGVGNTCWPRSWRAPYAVHPHRRGEHCRPWGRRLPLPGSSPQAWGTHDTLALSGTCMRFIPTGVGNTSLGCLLPACKPVHPHRRGEHIKPRLNMRSGELRKQELEQSSQQRFPSSSHVVHKLTEAQIPGSMVLGDTSMWAQPCSQ